MFDRRSLLSTVTDIFDCSDICFVTNGSVCSDFCSVSVSLILEFGTSLTLSDGLRGPFLLHICNDPREAERKDG